jgi:hypothetical protein
MAADVADACDLPRGIGLTVSFFFAVTNLNDLRLEMPVRQERGNVSNETKCATKIFRYFWMARNIWALGTGRRPRLAQIV